MKFIIHIVHTDVILKFSVLFIPGKLAALVDTESLSSRVFVNIDASGEVPKSWLFVRGKQNSILVIEPKGQNYTTVTFCIEKDPMGWAWISPFLVNAVAGASPISILKDLKAALEETPANKIIEPVEEAAQKKLKEILKPTAATSMVEDKSASKSDLKATVKLLEEKLVRVTKTEKAENIDLSDLKRRIKEDIEKGKHLIAVSSK